MIGHLAENSRGKAKLFCYTNARKILFIVFLKQLAVRRACACM